LRLIELRNSGRFLDCCQGSTSSWRISIDYSLSATLLRLCFQCFKQLTSFRIDRGCQFGHNYTTQSICKQPAAASSCSVRGCFQTSQSVSALRSTSCSLQKLQKLLARFFQPESMHMHLKHSIY